MSLLNNRQSNSTNPQVIIINGNSENNKKPGFFKRIFKFFWKLFIICMVLFAAFIGLVLIAPDDVIDEIDAALDEILLEDGSGQESIDETDLAYDEESEQPHKRSRVHEQDGQQPRHFRDQQQYEEENDEGDEGENQRQYRHRRNRRIAAQDEGWQEPRQRHNRRHNAEELYDEELVDAGEDEENQNGPVEEIIPDPQDVEDAEFAAEEAEEQDFADEHFAESDQELEDQAAAAQAMVANATAEELSELQKKHHAYKAELDAIENELHDKENLLLAQHNQLQDKDSQLQAKENQLLKIKQQAESQTNQLTAQNKELEARIKALEEQNNKLTLQNKDLMNQVLEFQDKAKKLEQDYNRLVLPTSFDIKKELENAIKEWLNVRYVFGGDSKSGIDCSAFTKAVFEKFGVALPRVSYDQYELTEGEIIRSKNNLQIGDLVFFDTRVHQDIGKDISHVAIYMGKDKNGIDMIAHASSSKGVCYAKMSTFKNFKGAKRFDLSLVNP